MAEEEGRKKTLVNTEYGQLSPVSSLPRGHADILLARHAISPPLVKSQKNICVGGYPVSDYFVNTVQWNPGNTDTKGTRRSARIIRVSVLSGFSEKRPGHMFYRYKD